MPKEYMEESQVKPILMSSDNLEKYGFACFCSNQDPELKDGCWIRTIDMAVGGNKSEIQHFKIPQNLLVNLSQTWKIVGDKHFNIGLSQSAIESIKLLSERAGWNQTVSDLALMVACGKDGIFIAKYDLYNCDIPLGSGVSFPVNKDLCWIGMILVHPELRRQGIARAMMQTCLDHARKVQRKSIIGLDATPMGKQVYDSLGFKDSFLIWRSIISTDIDNGEFAKKTVMPFDLVEVRDYLEERNYPERFEIVQLLGKLQGSKNMMAISKDRIQGFIMSRPGRLKPFIGPLIADSPEIAKVLLMEVLIFWSEKGYDEVFMDIPEYHLEKEVLFIRSENVKTTYDYQIETRPVRSLMRMYQLISDVEIIAYSRHMDEKVLQQAAKGYKKTLAFMEKEKNDVVRIMYGTSGPEWS